MALLEKQVITMQAAVVESNRHLVVCSVPVPEVLPGGALVRVTGCGLCGSDVDKLLHRDVAPDTVLGHEVVGVIEGQRVAVAHHVPCGTCHFCLHQSPSMCRTFKATNIQPGGFAQYVAVSREHLAHTVFPLPDNVSDIEGSCMEPLACCIRAVERIPETIGKDVLIVGLGFVGCLTAQVLQHRGFKSYGVDLKPERVALAMSHQMMAHAADNAAEILETIRQQTDGRGVDCVFLTVVNAKTLTLAYQAVRDGGTLMLFASTPEPDALLNQNDLYFREITILSSYSPGLSQLKKAHRMICNREIIVTPLFTAPVSLADLDHAIREYAQGNVMKVFVTP